MRGSLRNGAHSHRRSRHVPRTCHKACAGTGSMWCIRLCLAHRLAKLMRMPGGDMRVTEACGGCGLAGQQRARCGGARAAGAHHFSVTGWGKRGVKACTPAVRPRVGALPPSAAWCGRVTATHACTVSKSPSLMSSSSSTKARTCVMCMCGIASSIFCTSATVAAGTPAADRAASRSAAGSDVRSCTQAGGEPDSRAALLCWGSMLYQTSCPGTWGSVSEPSLAWPNTAQAGSMSPHTAHSLDMT